MPRIRLAHWYAGHAPGDVVDVKASVFPGLVRDGRVAEVISDDPAVDEPTGFTPVRRPKAAARKAAEVSEEG